ncbi:hypothetical protein V8D89_013550 [Ganoderma adspersum]
MARATRSTTNHEKDKPAAADSPPASRKGASKKRKRTSNADADDTLPVKHPRTDSNEDASPDPEDDTEKKQGDLPSSGDVPIQNVDAADILDVLQLVDNQGLLDRVFPLPTDSGVATNGLASSSTSSMLSLRSLLKNPSHYPLKVLRTAVEHLHPISSHPRFRPSETAAQQLRFCNLATSLLGQASRNTAPVPLDAATIITDLDLQDDAASPTASPQPSAGVRPHKYALVQHLPSGDWWTSASSGVVTAEGTSKDLKNLHTAKADLVSIFPSASGSQLGRKGTLGDYVVKRASGVPPHKQPQSRRVSCGKFLDYGPYASFAPSFDQDGVEVGRVGMGEVIFRQHMKQRLRFLAKGKRRAFLAEADHQTEDAVMEDASASSGAAVAGSPNGGEGLTKDLESLLSSEEVKAIKSALDSLEMEQAVDELLQRNAKALQRLEELQLERLRAQGGGSSVVEVGSEEWDIAQGITDSLALLASLRPRPSNGDPEQAPLIPPASLLHKLQRTLPLSATEGWYGTLPEGRTTAFRDDTTVHVRASSVAASKSAPAPATPAKVTTPAPPYTPYGYTGGYQSQYRGYGAYASTTQGTSYYPTSTYNATTPQTAAAVHYPNAQYGATAQTQYYGWYANSGRSTPQPPTQTSNYTSYYGTTQQPQAQRAVANTVLSSAKQPTYTPAAWTGATGTAYAPPLPAHMRAAVGGTSTPGTPSPTTAAVPTYSAYYGGYAAPR